MYTAEKRIQIGDFPVNKDFGDDEDFFRLITDHGEVQLAKLPFQKGKPLPDTLSCRVKSSPGVPPILSHNMPLYVSEFYADGFSKGKEFEFRVVGKSSDGSGYYRLIDENGLNFKLHETKSPFSIGQTVKCKFEVLDPKVYILRRSDADTYLKMISMRDISHRLNLPYSQAQEVEKGLREQPFLAKTFEEYDQGYPTWIFTGLRAVRGAMSRWFVDAVNKMPMQAVGAILRGCRLVALHLLEGSGFLRSIRGAERTGLQAEITDFVEFIDIYIEALDIINRRGQKQFIDMLLRHLKESGYIYHPNSRFALMMILFRVSPELVNSSLRNIFDTLMGWDIDIWRAEPFRQSFVDQLEIFIADTSEEIDQFLIAETPADNEKIENVLTAIAIQHSLAIGSDDIDLRRNLSFFYRCLSLLRRAKADTLLHKSYLSLMGVKLPTDFTWSDIKETTMMMTRATVDPPANAAISAEPRFFIADGIEMEINKHGISVGRVDTEADDLIPNGMLPWPGMHVHAKIDRAFSRTKIRTIEGHVEFWADVEESLFEKRASTEYHGTKLKADIDDEVRIIIDRVITSPDGKKIEAFHCKIDDEHFEEGYGIMLARDLVSYNLHEVTVGAFRNDKGEPMHFDAIVVDIDENDMPMFSLLEAVQNRIPDLTYSGDVCRAVVTKDNGPGKDYSAISERGFGLFIKKDKNELRPYHAGNVLEVRITSVNGTNIYSEVVDGPLDGVHLTNAMMLKNILKAVTVDEEAQPEMELDDEDIIPIDDVREIIQILRYKAVAESDDNIRAFDYLSYAHVLARMLADAELMDVIRAHRQILLQHQQYAKNKQIFIDEVNDIENIVPGNPLVKRLAAKLKIVGALGRPEDNGHLWNIANNSTNDTEKNLAQLTLSYNLLTQANHDHPAAANIKDQIASTLNVSSEQRKLKYYGFENQYVEFKSTLVYPAQKGKSGISAADPDAQEKEILRIVAGFLNTTGGTLYIGVSDDHYERGLDEDFKFYQIDRSERNTPHRRKIKNLDNMANYLQNLIDSAYNLGVNAGEYAKVDIDPEAAKGVIVVKVDPCPREVYFDDKIYVRHSAKTVPLLNENDIEQFKKDRSMIYRQQKQALASATKAQDEEKAEKKHMQPVADMPAEAAVEKAESTDEENLLEPKITSRMRKNVLHEYEDAEHFVTPKFYIRFVNDHEYLFTDEEWSLNPDADRVDLAVLDDEADQYLLLIYEGEAAVKVPMREICQKTKNLPHSHYADRKLQFVVPVQAGQAVYSLHTNAKGTLYERVTPVEAIATASMGSAPERLFEAECGSTLLWEIVPAGKVSDFDAIKSTSLKRTQLGALVKGPASVKITPWQAVDAFYSRIKN